jgi:hypothetical protein
MRSLFSVCGCNCLQEALEVIIGSSWRLRSGRRRNVWRRDGTRLAVKSRMFEVGEALE